VYAIWCIDPSCITRPLGRLTKLVSAYSAYVSWCSLRARHTKCALTLMGGRGGGVCVNICVPSSALEKPNVVFNNKQAIWIRKEGWLTNRIDTREWVCPFKGEPLVYLS